MFSHNYANKNLKFYMIILFLCTIIVHFRCGTYDLHAFLTKATLDTFCPGIMHTRASCMLYKISFVLGVMHAHTSCMRYKISFVLGVMHAHTSCMLYKIAFVLGVMHAHTSCMLYKIAFVLG